MVIAVIRHLIEMIPRIFSLRKTGVIKQTLVFFLIFLVAQTTTNTTLTLDFVAKFFENVVPFMFLLAILSIIFTFIRSLSRNVGD